MELKRDVRMGIPLVLNMACRKKPGGGVVSGAGAQVFLSGGRGGRWHWDAGVLTGMLDYALPSLLHGRRKICSAALLTCGASQRTPGSCMYGVIGLAYHTCICRYPLSIGTGLYSPGVLVFRGSEAAVSTSLALHSCPPFIVVLLHRAAFHLLPTKGYPFMEAHQLPFVAVAAMSEPRCTLWDSSRGEHSMVARGSAMLRHRVRPTSIEVGHV